MDKKYATIDDAKNANAEFKKECNLIDEIIELINKNIELINKNHDYPVFTKRSPVVVNHSPTIDRNRSNDRAIPMETVTIQSFRREKSAEVENPIIHIGYAADEFARSYNSLAITIANHIYFRNNAYKPETEEGRALIAHELTHV